MNEVTPLITGIVGVVQQSHELTVSSHWNNEHDEPRAAYDGTEYASVDSDIAVTALSNETSSGSIQYQSGWSRLKSFLFESKWPICYFISLAFFGIWIAQRRRSKWPLPYLPVIILVFGLCAHFYFILTAGHHNVHVGSKILLTTLWISGFCTYVLALRHFRCSDQEYLHNLTAANWIWVNVSLYFGIALVTFVLFGDAYFQVIFDLVNIKTVMTAKCRPVLFCDIVFYVLATSVYWGLYSAVAVCCIFLCVCLSMCNVLTKGYRQIEGSMSDVQTVLKHYADLRKDIEKLIKDTKLWLLAHMVFVVIVANIYVWWEASTIFKYSYEYTAQIAGTLVVAYKFFFPFISASYVTWHEENLAQALNDNVDYKQNETFYQRQNLETFLSQSKRRGYGFRLYNIQINITIAIFSLLGSMAGLAHNFLKINI
jgi:hypothetical protein